jgi:hypothetical protein
MALRPVVDFACSVLPGCLLFSVEGLERDIKWFLGASVRGCHGPGQWRLPVRQPLAILLGMGWLGRPLEVG